MKSESVPLVSKGYWKVVALAVVIMLLMRGKEWIGRGIGLLNVRDASAPPLSTTIHIVQVAEDGETQQAVDGLNAFKNWIETVEPTTLIIEDTGKAGGEGDETNEVLQAVTPPRIQGLAGLNYVFFNNQEYEVGQLLPGTEVRTPYRIVSVGRRCVWLLATTGGTGEQAPLSQPFDDMYRIHYQEGAKEGENKLEIKRGVFLPEGAPLSISSDRSFHLKCLWENAAHFQIKQNPPLDLLCVMVE